MSGGFLAGDDLNVTLDEPSIRGAGSFLGAGGIMAFDDSRDMIQIAHGAMEFFAEESCGKCFPCRLGMEHLLEIVERIARCESRPEDLELMRTVGESMQAGSLCGHGQLGYNPVASALKYFGAEFDAHIQDRNCPTGTCLTARFSPRQSRR